MNETARRAEFGKPTLYACFKSKDEILFHVHMKGHEIKMDMLNAAIRKGRNGYEKFRAMGEAYRKWRVPFEGLCKASSDGMDDGSLRGDPDVERTVDLLFTTLRTVANHVILIQDPDATQLNYNGEAMYSHYLNIFLEAIKAR
jgi:AcrR family transcriptional regulator